MVLREEERDLSVVYVLHVAPGADECQLRTREEALAQAVSLAKRARVRAWLTDEGYDFVLLEDFRPVDTRSDARPGVASATVDAASGHSR